MENISNDTFSNPTVLLSGNHQDFVADVSKSDSVNALLKDVHSRFKIAPSVLVNCAGIVRDKFMNDMTESSFDEVINVNLKVTVF